MPIYGGSLDKAYFRSIAQEVMRKIVGQEVLYFKLSLSETKENVFGESKKKMYLQPILIACSVIPEDQNTEDTLSGSNRNQNMDVHFLVSDLKEINLVPEAGDIIEWEKSYYEVDGWIDNQRVMGKDNEYSLERDNENYGELWSITVKTHLSKQNKLNLIISR